MAFDNVSVALVLTCAEFVISYRGKEINIFQTFSCILETGILDIVLTQWEMFCVSHVEMWFNSV